MNQNVARAVVSFITPFAMFAACGKSSPGQTESAKPTEAVVTPGPAAVTPGPAAVTPPAPTPPASPGAATPQVTASDLDSNEHCIGATPDGKGMYVALSDADWASDVPTVTHQVHAVGSATAVAIQHELHDEIDAPRAAIEKSLAPMAQEVNALAAKHGLVACKELGSSPTPHTLPWGKVTFDAAKRVVVIETGTSKRKVKLTEDGEPSFVFATDLSSAIAVTFESTAEEGAIRNAGIQWIPAEGS